MASRSYGEKFIGSLRAVVLGGATRPLLGLALGLQSAVVASCTSAEAKKKMQTGSVESGDASVARDVNDAMQGGDGSAPSTEPLLLEDWPAREAALICATGFQCCGETPVSGFPTEAECREAFASYLQRDVMKILGSLADKRVRYQADKLEQCLDLLESAGCRATNEQRTCLEPRRWLEPLTGTGERCEEDFDCEGMNRCLDESGDSPCSGCDAWCTPGSQLGDECATDGECASGYCDAEEELCAPREPDWFLPTCEARDASLDLPEPADSSGCPSGTVVLSSEVQLQRLKGCAHVSGDLVVVQSVLSNLDGLESLTTIDGSLGISENEALQDIAGLQGLESVGGNLFIERNEQLVNLHGLESLREVAKSVRISGPALEEVELDALSGVGETIDLSPGGDAARVSMAALKTAPFLVLAGEGLAELSFDSLRTIEGDLLVLDSGGLANFTGLGALQQVLGGVNIQNNEALSDTSGLDSLREIGGDLVVAENPALVSLQAEALESVGAAGPDNPHTLGPTSAQLYVARNPKLEEVRLPSLKFVGEGGVRFYINPRLPQCQADVVAEQVGLDCECADNSGSGSCP